MDKIPILGIPIHKLTRSQLLEKLDELVATKRSHQIATVNAEFLVAAQKDAEFRAVLQQTTLNTADGIGVLWASRYLAMPLWNVLIVRIWIQIFQLFYSLLAIIFYPKYVREKIPQKISGSEAIWWIANHAAQKNYSIFLLGGYNNTADLVSKKLKEKYPALKIAGTYAGSPAEQGIVEKINQVKPDILLVAYGQIRQEKWIAQNLQKLAVSAAIGVGGTFDYIAGIRPYAPQILRSISLEWLHRLFTQPFRWKRIATAIFTFPWYIMRHRLQVLKPYRRNVVACVVNEENEIFIGLRGKRGDQYEYYEPKEVHWQMPQGGVDEGESNEEAIVRELKEEIGVKHIEAIGEILNAHTYEWPIVLKGKDAEVYRGQAQTLYFVRFHSYHDKIIIDKREFTDYKWIPKEKLLETIHPVRRKLAEVIVKNFDRFVN